MEEGRAPSRYSRGHGFESRSSLNFSGFPFVTAIPKNAMISNLNLSANAQKNRAKSANRGHNSEPNLPSFSVYNKVLMSL